MANLKSLDLEASSSQYASISDGSQTGLDLSTDFTFEAWCKVEALANMHIIAKGDFATSSGAYQLNIGSSGKIQLDITDDGSTTGGHYMLYRTDNDVITAGFYYHVSVTWDMSAEICIIRINGKVVANSLLVGSTTGATINNSADAFRLGARDNSGVTSFFDGLLDDVRIWSDIRTEQEILDNMSNELVGDEAGLVAYWKLNDDYLDETSNNNDLTATGSPVFSTTLPFPPINIYTWLAPDGSSRIGDASANKFHCQQFEATANGTIETLKFYARNKNNSPTDGITVEIWSDSADEPDAIISGATEDIANGSIVDGGNSWDPTEDTLVTFSSPPAVVSGTKYWVVVYRQGSLDASHYWNWWRDNAGDPYGDGILCRSSDMSTFDCSPVYDNVDATLEISITGIEIIDLTESVTLAEVITKETAKPLTETLVLVEDLVAKFIANKAITETTTLIVSATTKITAKILTETVTLVVTLASKISALRLTEAIALVPTIATIKMQYRTLTDAIALVPSASTVLTATQSFIEGITTGDRLYGLLNGVNMNYVDLYVSEVGDYVDQYFNV